MNELIKVTQHEILHNSVNARDLHSYLEIGKDYSNWIKAQIERADLVKDVDYVVFAQKGEVKIEYFLTIETGKNIAMLSQSQKGKEVRAYFIECEKQLKKAFVLPDFTNPAIAARAWADEVEAKLIAQEKIKEKDKYIVATNQAQIAAGEILVREFVKANDIIDLGEKGFYSWMREQGIVLKNSNEPYQKYVKPLGYFNWKPTEEMHGGKFRYTLTITPRGKVWLAARYMAWLDNQL